MVTVESRIENIQDNPETHRHLTMDGLIGCCMHNGAFEFALLEAHEGLFGTNGGVSCDVPEGPCACGAWHKT
jgi:hypothetical protein